MAEATTTIVDPKGSNAGAGAAGAGAGAAGAGAAGAAGAKGAGAGAAAAGAGAGAAAGAKGAAGSAGGNAGNQGAGAGAASDPTSILTDPKDPAAGATVAWPNEGFPDNWRDRMALGNEKVAAVLKRFQSPAGLANAILADRQALSEGRLRPALPGNATPEQISEYRKANGIPEAPTGYLEKLPAGLVIGEGEREIAGKFAESMHALNAPPEVVHAALKAHYDAVAFRAQQFADMNEEAKNAGIHELSVEWGGTYKSNLTAIENMLSTFDGETRQFIHDLRDSKGLMATNNPGFLKALAKLAVDQDPANTVVPNHGGKPGVAVDQEIAAIEGKMRGPNAQAEYWGKPEVQERYRTLLRTREQIQSQVRAA